MSAMSAALAKSIKPMIKSALVNGGGQLGGASAAYLGVPGSARAMADAGRHLGARISKLIGSGDYASNSVSANSLIHPKGLSAVSAFGDMGGATIRIKHREFVGDVVTSAVAGQFTISSYPINPGLSNSFPFLSTIAVNYDQYVFHGLVYEFVSSTAGTASGAMGTIIMAADYNPAAPTYGNKHIMENSGYAVSCRLDGNAMYGMECAASQNAHNGYFVRDSKDVSNLYDTDLGLMQVATAPSSSFPNNSVIGELWVTYDVELKRPSLTPNRFGYARIVRSGVGPTTPLGTLQTSLTAYGSAVDVKPLNSTRLEFAACNTGDIYKVDVQWTGATQANVLYPALTYSGCSLFDVFAVNPQPVVPSTTLSASSALTFYVVITGTDPSTPSVTFGGTGQYPTGSASCMITISCVGSGYTAAQL